MGGEQSRQNSYRYSEPYRQIDDYYRFSSNSQSYPTSGSSASNVPTMYGTAAAGRSTDTNFVYVNSYGQRSHSVGTQPSAPPAPSTQSNVGLAARVQPSAPAAPSNSFTARQSSRIQTYIAVNSTGQYNTGAGPRMYPTLPETSSPTSTGAVPRVQPTVQPASQPNPEPVIRVPRTRDADETMNCPTCKKRFNLQIYICKGSHSSCSECKTEGKPCGKCGEEITNMRDFAVEDLIAEKKVPCPNKKNGCLAYVKLLSVESHIKECPFNEIICPLQPIYGKCTWRGKLDQLVSHFDSTHPEQRQANVDTEMMLLNISDDHQIVYLVEMGRFIFLVHFKIHDRKVYMTVQLIGTTMSASKWLYEIQVYNKSEPRKKYQYSDVCVSNSTPVNEIFNASKCMVLPFSYALTFLNGGMLMYKFYIKKDMEAQDEAGNVPRTRVRGRGRGRGRQNVH